MGKYGLIQGAKIMYLYFVKEYIRNGVKFEKGTTYFVSNDVLARYLIRNKIAVQER
jgi:hypothetical protein